MNKLIYILLFFSFTKTDAQNETTISRDWTSFHQSIFLQTKVKKKFKVIAFVKVETDDPNAWAGVWARVDTKTGENSFFDNMSDRPVNSKVWQSYIVEGTIDENSNVLNFGGLCQSNGKFYFDKFELFIENEKQVFEPYPLLSRKRKNCKS
jgi:hypothetical protein